MSSAALTCRRAKLLEGREHLVFAELELSGVGSDLTFHGDVNSAAAVTSERVSRSQGNLEAGEVPTVLQAQRQDRTRQLEEYAISPECGFEVEHDGA
ncbi:MAG: hypothetical protein R3B90_05615 [Planctomycetaceae bacterium]